MASEKISQLPVTTTSTNGDLYTLVQGGVNKSITFTALQAAIALVPSAGITILTGDVLATGPGSASAVVAFVGGQSASAIAAAAIGFGSATSSNTPSTIVERDSGGNFSAGTITANIIGSASLNLLKSGDAMTGILNMNGNEIVNVPTPVNPGDVSNKGYVDNFAVGIIPQANILAANLMDDSLSAPPAFPIIGESYIIGPSPTGLWAPFGAGRLVYWSGSQWLDELHRMVEIGDRFGVNFDHLGAPIGGSFVGKQNNIVTVTNATPGFYSYSYQVPQFRWTVLDANPSSHSIGTTWYYDGTGWVIFNISYVVQPGNGIGINEEVVSTLYDGTTIGINGSNELTVISSPSFSGSLSGDVTGTQSSTVVGHVGGQTAAAVAAAAVAVAASTSIDTPSTLVERDSSGNFSAGTITANLTGNASTATSTTNFSGSLSGDVTGTQSATAISSNVVTSKLLTSYAVGANSPILSTDSILQAFGKVQGQINDSNLTAITSLNGDVTAAGPGPSSSTVNFVGGKTASDVAAATGTVDNASASNVPSTLVKRDSSGNFSAGTITASLSGSATSFTGSLSGDVTGTQSATVVSLVGGKTAAAVASAVTTVGAATNLDTPSTLVERDSSGNFSAGTITANLTGNATTATTSGNFTGSLSGDVTGTQSATIISVGAVTDAKASLADKPSVSVVSTSNQALSGLPTIDGVTTTVGMLVLLASQGTASQNGPWVIASGSWARPSWYPTGGITQAFQFITCFVRQGLVYQGSTWTQTAAAPITIDTTSTSWIEVPFALSGSTVTGILPNANTTATNLNTPSTIISRDSSGNFSAGTITANLTGNASGTALNITAASNSTITTLSALTTASSLTVTGSQVTGFTQGSVLFAGASGQITQDNSQFYWDDTAHALGIGTIPSSLAIIDVVNNSGTTKTVQATGYGGTVGFRGRYANGTLSLPTAATAGNTLNLMSGRGYGTSQFALASTGAFTIIAGETFTNTSNATYMTWFVTPTGSVTSAEAMRLNSTGNLLIGTTTDNATDKLQVNGSESISGNTKLATGTSSVVTAGGASSTAIHQINGGVNYTTNTVTSNYSVDSTTTDYIIYPNSTSSAITITLPAPTNGRVLNIQDLFGNAAVNNITIKPHASETINGLSQVVILTNYGGATLSSNGVNWVMEKTPTSGFLFLTTGTTYTTPINVTPQTRYKFTLIGGGAGGSGSSAAANHSTGGGGGAGVSVFTQGLSASTSYTISIGAAGTAGPNATVGGAGGNTTLAIGVTTYTAGGGQAAAATTGNGGTGGTATNGNININGQAGGGSSTVATATGGQGGNSAWAYGLGGAVLGVGGNGLTATGYGGGGSGANGSGNTGGAGTQGCIVVEWSN
jgi:hypothetical protein